MVLSLTTSIGWFSFPSCCKYIHTIWLSSSSILILPLGCDNNQQQRKKSRSSLKSLCLVVSTCFLESPLKGREKGSREGTLQAIGWRTSRILITQAMWVEEDNDLDSFTPKVAQLTKEERQRRSDLLHLTSGGKVKRKKPNLLKRFKEVV